MNEELEVILKLLELKWQNIQHNENARNTLFLTVRVIGNHYAEFLARAR